MANEANQPDSAICPNFNTIYTFFCMSLMNLHGIDRLVRLDGLVSIIKAPIYG